MLFHILACFGIIVLDATIILSDIWWLPVGAFLFHLWDEWDRRNNE